MVNGFLLSRQWLERDDGSQDLVFWLATDDAPVQLVIESQESVFFVPAALAGQVSMTIGRTVSFRTAPVSLTDFGRQAVVAFYFRSQKGLNIARSRLERLGIAVLEADVRPTDRYLMERFITGAIEVAGTPESGDGYVRYTNPRLKPCTYTPSLRVASLDIETSWNENILYSIAVHSPEIKGPEIKDTAVNKVFMVGDATNKAGDFVEFIHDEKRLIERFLEWFAALDPDVVIGWAVVGFDLKFLQARCDAHGIALALGRAADSVRWRTSNTGAERDYALVPGRVVLDGIEMLRTATWSFESFSLEFVARELLGRGKLVEDVDARAVEIQEMFRTDKARLADYNLEDCVLVAEIFETTRLIEFAIERSRLTGLEMDRPGGSVAAFDFLYLPRLHRKGFVAPVVADDSGAGSPGGYVLDSKPGLYDHVIVLDFKSLYPSIIRTFHVDPLALVCGLVEDDAIAGFKGGKFSRRNYILPEIIEDLWRARDRAKRAGRAPLSQAIKIIMNSFYGVLGTPGCRFFDPRLVSSITLRGHEILQTTRDLIEARGLTVIYGDTDSVFVLLREVRDKDDADSIGRMLMNELNEWWRTHLKTEFDIESCLEVEYETHFTRFLMPTVRGSEVGSKKRYAGMITEDGEARLVFKGLESVRSDWTQLAREFQQGLYERIFRNQVYEAFIKETVEAVARGDCDDKLVFRRRLRRKLDEYEKNVPPHVRAARRGEEIRTSRGLAPIYSRGSWVEYVMTINGPEPKSYAVSPLDYQFYIDRQLAPVADAILSFKSTSIAEITDRQLGLF